jgi:hypothetical protein
MGIAVTLVSLLYMTVNICYVGDLHQALQNRSANGFGRWLLFHLMLNRMMSLSTSSK